ncbi:MAG: TonB-dependent receptor, partial [Proteobacteria bacterium]|nr:TonB-dependent receptor [Pseudomonadota bacterium]
NFAIRASGPIFDLPAGSVNLSALIETRDEELDDYLVDNYDFLSGAPGSLTTGFVPLRDQSTDSVYLEVLIPVFSRASDIPLVQALDFQISGRYDDYSTKSPAAFTLFDVDDPIESDRNEFDSFDYTLGLRYEMSDDLLLRASYGTGFLPPSVGQIFRQSNDNFFIVGDDPKRNGENIFVQGTVLFGGNPDLTPEESESWSVGAILTPRALPGFRLSLDYSVIEKTDEILFADNQLILDNEDSLPGRVIRAELTQADIDAGFDVGRVIGIDRSLLNFANTKSEALDIQIDQLVETDRYGEFRFFAVATKMFGVEQQFTATSEPIDQVGFDNGPLEWRANFGLTWTSPRSVWLLGWNAQHYDSYRVYGADSSDAIIEQSVLRQGAESIPSETYHDLFLKLYPDELDGMAGGLLEGVEVRVGIQNAFDKVPEARASFSPTDGRFSVYGDNRLRRFTLSLSKQF